MNNWKETTLREVLKVNELTVDNSYPFDEIEYVDIASVEERRILQTQKLKLEDAPSRARRIVKDNDILISTVRPNLKHYCYIKKASENLIASTGFAVITAKKSDSGDCQESFALFFIVLSMVMVVSCLPPHGVDFFIGLSGNP